MSAANIQMVFEVLLLYMILKIHTKISTTKKLS